MHDLQHAFKLMGQNSLNADADNGDAIAITSPGINEDEDEEDEAVQSQGVNANKGIKKIGIKKKAVMRKMLTEKLLIRYSKLFNGLQVFLLMISLKNNWLGMTFKTSTSSISIEWLLNARSDLSGMGFMYGVDLAWDGTLTLWTSRVGKVL